MLARHFARNIKQFWKLGMPIILVTRNVPRTVGLMNSALFPRKRLLVVFGIIMTIAWRKQKNILQLPICNLIDMVVILASLKTDGGRYLMTFIPMIWYENGTMTLVRKKPRNTKVK